MENCDVCGNPLTDNSDTVQLYTARLLKREYSKSAVGSRKTTANYEHFKPVIVHACNKHRKELAKQRILPAVITFVLIVIPVLFLLKLIPVIGSSIAIQLPLALLIAALASTKITQTLVRYDNFLALMMTIKEKRSGSDKEFLTETKYRRYTGVEAKVSVK